MKLSELLNFDWTDSSKLTENQKINFIKEAVDCLLNDSTPATKDNMYRSDLISSGDTVIEVSAYYSHEKGWMVNIREMRPIRSTHFSHSYVEMLDIVDELEV